jgi:hypothetical protein
MAASAAAKPVYGSWGFVLLALAAGSLDCDRFFGYSSVSLRHMATAIGPCADLSDFQLTRVKEMAALGGKNPGATELHRLIVCLDLCMTAFAMRPSHGWSNSILTCLKLESRLYRVSALFERTRGALNQLRGVLLFTMKHT